MSSIPEEDVQPNSSVARQVFHEATPSASASESEAKASEDILSASADNKEEEREATPPASDPVILEENVIKPDPPAVKQMEVENPEAATNNATEANDSVKAEDNVEPEVNVNAEV